MELLNDSQSNTKPFATFEIDAPGLEPSSMKYMHLHFS